MPSQNLHSIIVSKRAASGLIKATELAGYHGSAASPSSTGSSWRFGQRPAKDFVKGSFRSFPIPERPGVILVYGRLKRSKNPSSQGWLQFRDGGDCDNLMQEWDFFIAADGEIKKSKTLKKLQEIARRIEDRGIRTPIIRALSVKSIADRARSIRITRRKSSTASDERIYQDIIGGRIGNPSNRSAKGSKRVGGHIKLKSPKKMIDPGPCAWLGSIIEWSWGMRRGDVSKEIDENGNAIWGPQSEWMFMWSPRYKAVVSIRRPKDMYKLAKVSRYGGAAKMFEHFMARDAKDTFEINVPDVKLKKLGSNAAHIVYRSDKWSPSRKNSDYIHTFGKGVNIYCGPSLNNPEVFLCFGGKLTLTKRGLVW